MCSPFQSELDKITDLIPSLAPPIDRLDKITDLIPSVPSGIELLLAPIFMMTMCARGFVLWIINVGLAIYLGVAAGKLIKKVR
jgi:hypothetical protein